MYNPRPCVHQLWEDLFFSGWIYIESRRGGGRWEEINSADWCLITSVKVTSSLNLTAKSAARMRNMSSFDIGPRFLVLVFYTDVCFGVYLRRPDAESPQPECGYLQAVDGDGVPLCLSCQKACPAAGGAWDTRFCSFRYRFSTFENRPGGAPKTKADSVADVCKSQQMGGV